MKTNTIKLIALVATLLTSSFAFAEEQQDTTQRQWQVGDTIVVKKSTERYLTGERPSKWVYLVEHTIQQVGGKRFPDGLLIRGIYSWLAPDAVLLKGAAKDEITQRALEVDSLSAAEKQALDNYANLMGSKVIKDEAAQEEVVDAQPQEEAPAAKTTPASSDVNPYAYKKEGEGAPVAYALKPTHLDKMHRFSIGVRGGVASLMHESDVMGDWKAGFDGLLDLQYAYYFGGKKNQKVNPGILTGLSIGWAQSGLQAGVDTAYTVITVDGDIDYTIKAENVKENDGQLQLEIPVMFTMLTEKGFFMNVGPKVVIPVFSHYKQNITTPDINAYFPTEGVHVNNELITGLVKDNQLNTKGKWNPSKVNVMLTAELGWEWILKSENSIGLGVFANYSVYDLYKNNTDNKSLINVTPPTSGPANVDVLSATDTYANGMGYFDCGLKLVYHFNWRQKQQ